jgi:hypothetical protein
MPLLAWDEGVAKQLALTVLSACVLGFLLSYSPAECP